jgi:hypothetical protein
MLERGARDMIRLRSRSLGRVAQHRQATPSQADAHNTKRYLKGIATQCDLAHDVRTGIDETPTAAVSPLDAALDMWWQLVPGVRGYRGQMFSQCTQCCNYSALRATQEKDSLPITKLTDFDHRSIAALA